MQSQQCPTCIHYLGGFTCDAYPDGIPQEIVSGEWDHREPQDGDRGIRWEQDPSMPADPTTESEDDTDE